jgi:putative ABC transport system permease protein
MSVLSDIVERVRSIVFRRRDERELAEELRFHADMEAELLQQHGVSTREAHRRSALALGGIERVKDDVRDARGTRLFHDIGRDVGYAARTLARNPGFATVAILTLGLGIGGTTAVFSAVDAVLLQPLPYQEPGRLVRLYHTTEENTTDRGFVTPVHFVEYRRAMSSLEATAAIYTYDESGADLGSGGDVRRIRVLPVTAAYWDVIRVQPRLGRALQEDEETGALVVVVSDQLFRERFGGDQSAVGRGMVLSGRTYTVVGVMPAGYEDPIVGKIDAWTPVDLRPGFDASNADNHYLTVIGRLRPATGIGRAQAELDQLGRTLATKYPDASHTRARLDPLKDDIVGSSSRALQIMLGAVALVLVLVCVNIANLLLVRGSDRAREFALRSALGAERPRLVRQTLIESLTLALVGDVAGVVIARFAMSAIVALGAGSIPRLSSLALDAKLLVFSLVIASISAVGFGVAPALHAARARPGDVLREQSRSATSSGSQMRVRQWLVVSQVALAFVLLVGAGLLIASLQRLRNVDIGVKPEGVLTFELHLPDARYDGAARARFYDEVAARLGTLPGVRAAGAVSRLPVTGSFHSWGVRARTGKLVGTEQGGSEANQRVITGDYFGAVGIPVLEGRVFDSHDDASAPARVLVSKNLAERLFPGDKAVGQQVSVAGVDREIIGVVGNVATDGEGRLRNYVYHAHRQFSANRNWALTQVVRSTRSPEALQAAVRQAVAQLDPQLVVHKPALLTDVIGQGESQRVFTLRLLTTFAGVALALAALGLFGVLSYGVRLRSREFGIRMALGADRGLIRRMVLREGLLVTAIGTGIGLVGAIAMSRLLASLVFGISALDPRVMAVAAGFMGLVSATAAYLPAYRATAVEPRTVLQ